MPSIIEKWLEVRSIVGLLVLIIFGFALISIGSQSNSLISAPLFYGGIVAVIVGGFAMYKAIVD